MTAWGYERIQQLLHVRVPQVPVSRPSLFGRSPSQLSQGALPAAAQGILTFGPSQLSQGPIPPRGQ